MFFFFLVIFAVIIVVLIYLKNSKAHSYWKEKGIRYVRPWPLFGYMASNILQIKAFAHIIEDLYKTFPEQRYFGCYQFFEPSLLIRDPELIKTIMVKEFETFPEHRSLIDVEGDPLWAKNIFAMKGGEQWRDMRSTLSPVFTSSKMRLMFGLMKDIAKQVNEHYSKQRGTISIEMKDATTRFANDVIATTAFGITCNSFKNPENEFFMKTKELTDFKITRMLKFFGYSMCPRLMNFFQFRMFGDNIYNFYRNIIKQTIKIREEEGIIRPDMIHLLLQARKGSLDYGTSADLDSGFACVEESELGKPHKRRKAEITDDDITAQAFLFFFAGFETVSTAMSHLVFELALHPEIQETLRKEIDAAFEECAGGEITYETLLRMKYLDMVVTETLRKWPPAIINDRKSTRPFTINPTKIWEKLLTLDTGTLCLFPIYAIHRDPKNYPEPEKFNPERFSDKNKTNIKPYTYLPFGAGPRNCIGSRFALLEIKTFIFYLLSEFEIVTTDKTKSPLIISKKKFNPIPDKGFWVGLKPRHKKIA